LSLWRTGQAVETSAMEGSGKATGPLPCHRVIGSTGSLVGCGGGLARKEQLLKLEGAALP
jgi:methylated-DNA-[protein]-cysteine S-methyltransferase